MNSYSRLVSKIPELFFVFFWLLVFLIPGGQGRKKRGKTKLSETIRNFYLLLFPPGYSQRSVRTALPINPFEGPKTPPRKLYTAVARHAAWRVDKFSA